MKTKLIYTVLFFIVSNFTVADIVGDLQGLRKSSETYRELAIECYVEMRLSKDNGWQSEDCKEFQTFAQNKLHTFTESITEKSGQFNKQTMSAELSYIRKNEALKNCYLFNPTLMG